MTPLGSSALLSRAMFSNTHAQMCVCFRGQRQPPPGTVSRVLAGQLLGNLVLPQIPQEPTVRVRADNINTVMLVSSPPHCTG